MDRDQYKGLFEEQKKNKEIEYRRNRHHNMPEENK